MHPMFKGLFRGFIGSQPILVGVDGQGLTVMGVQEVMRGRGGGARVVHKKATNKLKMEDNTLYNDFLWFQHLSWQRMHHDKPYYFTISPKRQSVHRCTCIYIVCAYGSYIVNPKP